MAAISRTKRFELIKTKFARDIKDAVTMTDELNSWLKVETNPVKIKELKAALKNLASLIACNETAQTLTCSFPNRFDPNPDKAAKKAAKKAAGGKKAKAAKKGTTKKAAKKAKPSLEVVRVIPVEHIDDSRKVKDNYKLPAPRPGEDEM